MERVVTCPIYHADLVKVKGFQNKKGIKKLADVLRIAVEYADSHGVFS